MPGIDSCGRPPRCSRHALPTRSSRIGAVTDSDPRATDRPCSDPAGPPVAPTVNPGTVTVPPSPLPVIDSDAEPTRSSGSTPPGPAEKLACGNPMVNVLPVGNEYAAMLASTEPSLAIVIDASGNSTAPTHSTLPADAENVVVTAPVVGRRSDSRQHEGPPDGELRRRRRRFDRLDEPNATASSPIH